MGYNLPSESTADKETTFGKWPLKNAQAFYPKGLGRGITFSEIPTFGQFIVFGPINVTGYEQVKSWFSHYIILHHPASDKFVLKFLKNLVVHALARFRI